MEVLSIIDLPSAVPLGVLTGQYGCQAVLEELNNNWRGSGSGVIFGQDTFGQRFAAFSKMIGEQISAIQGEVLRTVETVCCPNKFQEITCKEDLYSIPQCMYIPILTMPEVRPLFEDGCLSAWGLKPEDLPEEDVYGRLLQNGTFDTGALDYDPDAMVKFVVCTGDPDIDFEDLRKIRTSRAFISSFLEEQMGEGGDEMDITDVPNRMGKLRKLKEPKNKAE